MIIFYNLSIYLVDYAQSDCKMNENNQIRNIFFKNDL